MNPILAFKSRVIDLITFSITFELF